MLYPAFMCNEHRETLWEDVLTYYFRFPPSLQMQLLSSSFNLLLKINKISNQQQAVDTVLIKSA